MGFYILSKFPVGADSMEVSIRMDKPYTIITEVINLNSDGTDDKVIKAVLESFYQRHYKDRAEKEQIADIRKIAEEVKEMAYNGNSLGATLIGELIANDRWLWASQYASYVSFLPELKAGEKYEFGQYVKVKDSTIPSTDAKGQWVAVRIVKKDGYAHDGKDILKLSGNLYEQGFDIRRYEEYPRVQLKTATDNKITK